MIDFDITQYGPACEPLLRDPPSVEIGPGTPNHACRTPLEALDPDRLFSGRLIVDEDHAACCLAALWLRHNFLDESHRLSQEIHTPTGSYWHGLMHRREPDFSNAKYWFRKVGDHAIHPALSEAAREIAAAHAPDVPAAFLAEQDHWDAAGFVDLCQVVTRGREEGRTLCEAIALAEWQLLFDHCFHAALGK